MCLINKKYIVTEWSGEEKLVTVTAAEAGKITMLYADDGHEYETTREYFKTTLAAKPAEEN